MADAISATSAMATTTGSRPHTRLVAQRLPLAQRLKCALIAWAWTRLLKSLFMLRRIRKSLSPREEKDPDLIKTYPVRKSLPVRVFFPPSYSPGSSPASTKLPTLLTIHGGGFVLGSPEDNDGWNRTFAKRHNFLVVALNYSKAPAHPFPVAIGDIEALVCSVLADTATLPIDPSRVALAGWSAGGNLALAAAQLETVRSRVAAVVPLYPAVDFVTGAEAKARARPYKPALGGFRARDRDFLLAMTDTFQWAYVSPGQRCDDPLLSPLYAAPETLPRNVFIIACELDLLAAEAQRMACKLTGRRVPDVEEKVGDEQPLEPGVVITEGDERFAWEHRTEDGRRYRWLLVPDTIHGFDQDNIGGMVKDAVTMEDARIKTTKVIDLIGKWLLDGPFGQQSS